MSPAGAPAVLNKHRTDRFRRTRAEADFPRSPDANAPDESMEEGNGGCARRRPSAGKTFVRDRKCWWRPWCAHPRHRKRSRLGQCALTLSPTQPSAHRDSPTRKVDEPGAYRHPVRTDKKPRSSQRGMSGSTDSTAPLPICIPSKCGILGINTRRLQAPVNATHEHLVSDN